MFNQRNADWLAQERSLLLPCRTLCSTLISNFRRVLYVVCFLLGNYPASGVYMPTFRNTLFHLHRQLDVSSILPTSTCLWRWNRQSVPKRRLINSRRRVITQKKAYGIFNLFNQHVAPNTNIFLMSGLTTGLSRRFSFHYVICLVI